MSNGQPAPFARNYDFDTDIETKAFLTGLAAAEDYVRHRAQRAATAGGRAALLSTADALHSMAERGAANTHKIPAA